MHGKLDPEDNVMDDTIIASRRAAAIMKSVSSKLSNTIAELGWECYDDVSVDIGGTSVYMIDGAGTKWAPVKGTRKYNKDAFIVIKNNSRNPIVPSVNDDPERLQHHSKMEASDQQKDSGESSGELRGTP